jgi:Ca2+-binding RTX toxin-like protein
VISMARTLKLGVASAIAAAALIAPGVATAATPSFPPGVQIGTPNDDVLVGSPYSDIIFGLAGNDRLYGRQGADRIFGGLGDDLIRGGSGPDTLRGGRGVDHIFGGPGNDLILAAGDDAIDVISCGDGRQDLAIVDPNDEVANDCEFVWARDPEN